MGVKDTNLYLNEEDIALLADTGFFTRKKAITEHVIRLLGELESELDISIQKYRSLLPESVFHKRGKISRGENYLGLPYVILDYPAIFEKNGVFAFRTLMWWGNSFSFTFHLSGHFLERYQESILQKIEELDEDILICINANPWEHHHRNNNYIPVKEFLKTTDNNPDYFKNKGFLKLSKIIPLEQHSTLVAEGKEFLTLVLNHLQ